MTPKVEQNPKKTMARDDTRRHGKAREDMTRHGKAREGTGTGHEGTGHGARGHRIYPTRTSAYHLSALGLIREMNVL